MSAWVELASGAFIHLDRVEAVVPTEDPKVWRFYPPRAQRGGRPTGRPTARVQAYNEDRNFWEGEPVRLADMLSYLRDQGLPTSFADVVWSDPTGSQEAQDGVAPPAAPRLGSDPDAA